LSLSEKTIHELTRYGRRKLGDHAKSPSGYPLIDNPELEVDILLGYVLEKPRSYLLAHPQHEVTLPEFKHFEKLIEQRASGCPIAYITGEKEFWSLPLQVTSDTLIPRPETELLVEKTLDFIQTITKPVIADLGTGSGAIAIAVAHECRQAQVIAIDNSLAALTISQQNANRLNVNNCWFINSHWCDSLKSESLDLLVSNPPYVANDDPHWQQTDIRFEPRSALLAGHAGMDAINYLIKHAKRVLKPGACILIEHGYDQQAQVKAAFSAQSYHNIKGFKDFSGIDRVCIAHK